MRTAHFDYRLSVLTTLTRDDYTATHSDSVDSRLAAKTRRLRSWIRRPYIRASGLRRLLPTHPISEYMRAANEERVPWKNAANQEVFACQPVTRKLLARNAVCASVTPRTMRRWRKKVCSALEAAGYPCWIAPRNAVPGTLYADGIVRALDESRVLVLILSKEAIASAHVGRELERAASKRHPIISLRTDVSPRSGGASRARERSTADDSTPSPPRPMSSTPSA